LVSWRRISVPANSGATDGAKEFGVLEALLRAAPGILSAEQLLHQAWDENADPFTNTVQVTIGRLRRKLGQPQPIHTIPGLGYRLSDPAEPNPTTSGT
jgi:DNA-binding response OmpR family regulator